MAARTKRSSGANPLYRAMRPQGEIMRGFPAPLGHPPTPTLEKFDAFKAHLWEARAHGAVHTNDPVLRGEMANWVSELLIKRARLPTTVAEWLLFVLNKIDPPKLATGRPINRRAAKELHRQLFLLLKKNLHLPIEDALERAARELKKSPGYIRNLYYSHAYRNWRAVMRIERNVARKYKH